jgi:hypothetical protein
MVPNFLVKVLTYKTKRDVYSGFKSIDEVPTPLKCLCDGRERVEVAAYSLSYGHPVACEGTASLTVCPSNLNQGQSLRIPQRRS